MYVCVMLGWVRWHGLVRLNGLAVVILLETDRHIVQQHYV